MPDSSSRPRRVRWLVAALTVPVLALVVAVAVLVPAITADPTPLCAGFGR